MPQLNRCPHCGHKIDAKAGMREVLRVHQEHPEWTVPMIAKELGVNTSKPTSSLRAR